MFWIKNSFYLAITIFITSKNKMSVLDFRIFSPIFLFRMICVEMINIMLFNHKFNINILKSSVIELLVLKKIFK